MNMTKEEIFDTVKTITVDELENHNRTEIIDEVEFFTDLIVESYLAERRMNNNE